MKGPSDLSGGRRAWLCDWFGTQEIVGFQIPNQPDIRFRGFRAVATAQTVGSTHQQRSENYALGCTLRRLSRITWRADQLIR